MRRLIVLGLPIALLATAAAHGILLGGTHQGGIRDDPQSSVSFEMKRTESGHRRLVEFFASGMDFTCEGGNPGQTSAIALNRGFRVKRDRTFKGKADATILGFDPPARLRGKVRRHGRVVGTLRVHGEIDPEAQPGIDCDTGVQGWKAIRTPSPPAP